MDNTNNNPNTEIGHMENVLSTLQGLSADALDAFKTVVIDMDKNGFDFGCYMDGDADRDIAEGEALVNRLGAAGDLVSGDHHRVNDTDPVFQVSPDNGLQEWLYTFENLAAVLVAIDAITPADHVEDDEADYTPMTGDPQNALTGKAYQGKNVGELLGAMDDGGYTDCRFLTFRQALEMGRCVRKGEKAAARIVKFVTFEKKSKRTGKTKTAMAPKGYCVFNIEQTRPMTDEETAKHAASKAAKEEKKAA